MFRIASVSASGTEVVEFDLVLEYGYLQFMGSRENDKRSMTANATFFSACRPLDRSLKRRGSVIQSAFIPSAWRP